MVQKSVKGKDRVIGQQEIKGFSTAEDGLEDRWAGQWMVCITQMLTMVTEGPIEKDRRDGAGLILLWSKCGAANERELRSGFWGRNSRLSVAGESRVARPGVYDLLGLFSIGLHDVG